MDIIFEKTLLYDFYGELLTEKQQRVFEMYRLDDLSLAEISEQMNISRQGVHDAIKKCEKQLGKYEEKLGLVEKFILRKNRITEIDKLSTIIENKETDLVVDNKLLTDNMKKINRITNEMLKDL